MDVMKTGKFIAGCRKELGLTQAALGEKLGITDRAVSKWETGKSLPDASIMLELCDILGINVNELLCGERIAADNYKEIAEKNMSEMIRLENEKNGKLQKAQSFIICSGLIISLFTIVCGFLIAFDNSFVSIALLYFGGAVMLVDVFYGAILEHDSGYYECQSCGHRYVPPTRAVMFSTHVGSDRLLKCPHCSKREWHKKVLTK